MKKNMKRLAIAVSVGLCALSIFPLAACGDTVIDYAVKAAQGTYAPRQKATSGAEIDDYITLDGKFEEKFYADKSWFEAKRTVNGKTTSMKMTTEIAPNGVLFGIEVDDDYTVSWYMGKPTAFNSGIEMYFAYGGETDPLGNLFELDLTAHGEINVRVWDPGKFSDQFLNYLYSYENAPAYAIQLKGGSIESENCTGYTMEYFLPYSLLGKTKRPEYVNVNPGVISPTSDAWVRVEPFMFGFMYDDCSWGKTEMYRFDKNGFAENEINITATGGRVFEQYGRSWCKNGEVKFTAKADAGKTLKSLTVNGNPQTVGEDGTFAVNCAGDLNIVASFE